MLGKLAGNPQWQERLGSRLRWKRSEYEGPGPSGGVGEAALLTHEDECQEAQRLITDHLAPGRWAAAQGCCL